MARYGRGRRRLFATGKARKRRWRPPGEKIKPAAYGMSPADLAKISGRGDACRLMQRLASGRWGEDE
jgi:hypothetical protein